MRKKQHSLLQENQVVQIDDLRKMDSSWNYEKENTKTLTHGIHSYPAMMIPQIANRLIDKFSQKGDLILDPFCGSGSTLVEAKANKRDAIGIDLNPLATLIARAKTTYIPPSQLKNTFTEIREKITSKKFDKINYQEPDFFHINYWFKDKVIKDLARIKAIIKSVNNKGVQQLLTVAFSETVRDVSSTRDSEFKLYRYNEEDLKKFNPNTQKVFLENFGKTIKAMEKSKVLSNNTQIKIITGDSSKKQSIEEGSIDLLVTSPPYGDSGTTVAYGQFSRLASQWLGIYPEDSNLDSKMLGGKKSNNLNNNLGSKSLNKTLCKIKKKNPKRAKQVLKFYEDLDECLDQISKYMKREGYVCFVVGNRTVAGYQIPTDKILSESIKRHSLEPKEIIIRDIPKKKMPKKNSPTNQEGVLEETMTKEYILIMKKT